MHISKEGDPYLRTLLVQGAHHILDPFGADIDLRRWRLTPGRARRQEWEEASRDCYGAEAGGLAASFVGERRSVRTVSQQQQENDAGSCISQGPRRKDSQKPKRRVPVTALIARPTSI